MTRPLPSESVRSVIATVRNRFCFAVVRYTVVLLSTLGWLGSICSRPERPRVNAIRMQREHLLVQLYRRRSTRNGSVEIAEIASSLFDVARRAVRIEHAMT